MFNVRFTYLPNCLYQVRAGWGSLPVAFETNVDGYWRTGTSSLRNVQRYAAVQQLEVRVQETSRGQYELSFLSRDEAMLSSVEDEWAQAEDWAHMR